jgi:hypothetical protein
MYVLINGQVDTWKQAEAMERNGPTSMFLEGNISK